MSPQQTAAEVRSAVSNNRPKMQGPKPARGKAQLKDRWPVLVLVPLVGAIVPLLNTMLETKRPERHSLVQNNIFAGAMYFGNVSLIEQQYQQATGQALNEPDLKKKIADAQRYAADNNFGVAASILSDVAQRAPVAAVYNNLGVAYANGGNLEGAEKAFHDALGKDPNYKAAWANLGLVQQKEGKLAEAQESFLKAPEFKPKEVAPSEPAPAPVAESQPNAANGGGHDILSPRSIALNADRQDAVGSGKPNYFRFVTPPTYRDLVEVSVVNRSTTLEPCLNLFNADRTNISGNQYNDTPGGNRKYTFVAAPNSTYYVAVEGWGSTAGDYTLAIRPLKAYDRYEPNDDIFHASPADLGKPVDAGIMDGDDVDYYQFRSAARGGNVEVSIANRSTTLEPAIRVFNADRTDISGEQYNDTPGANRRYTFAAEPNSTYYVSVHSWGRSAGDYTLTIRLQ